MHHMNSETVEHIQVPQDAESLLALAKEINAKPPTRLSKKTMEQVQQRFFKLMAEERKAMLLQFKNEGGLEEDFEPKQPLRDEFQAIYLDFKQRWSEQLKAQEKSWEDNKTKRLKCIESLKDLIGKEESLGKTFEQFRGIQDEWKACGPVAKADSSEIFRTYHHHLERFYDWVQLNKDLRDLDFQKNLEHKKDLIARAEALFVNENGQKAFKALQKLHQEWKEETGPVVPELRESIWEEFSAITQKIHDKKQAFWEAKKAQEAEKENQKLALIEALQALAKENPENHKTWQALDQQVQQVQEQWRSLGKGSEELFERYKGILKEIRHKKNQFYKQLKQEFQASIDALQAIVDEAERLKNSTDWNQTANQLKNLQKKWQGIKGAPRKESDQLWKKFRAACNTFFEALEADKKSREQALEANVEAKTKQLESWKAANLPKEKPALLAELKSIRQQWFDLGPLPRSAKKLQDDFNQWMDQQYKSLDIQAKELKKIKFNNQLEQWLAQEDWEAVKKEEQFLKRRKDQLQADLLTSEANLSMFSKGTDENHPLLKKAKQGIQQLKGELESLEEQLKTLRKAKKK